MSGRERRTSIGGQFAPRRIDMISSAAWRVLSLSARRVLDRVEIEMAAHGGTDNGRLPVTFADFQDYGIDRHAIAPAIREAVALGFLEVTQQGRAGNAEWRLPNMFRLTYRVAKGVKGDGSHEWSKIETVEEATTLAALARKTHFSRWGKKPDFSGGNPHRNGQIQGGKTPTTGQGGKTPTTLDISDASGVLRPPQPLPDARGNGKARPPKTSKLEVAKKIGLPNRGKSAWH